MSPRRRSAHLDVVRGRPALDAERELTGRFVLDAQHAEQQPLARPRLHRAHCEDNAVAVARLGGLGAVSGLLRQFEACDAEHAVVVSCPGP